jgi:hypothetical protein
MARSGLELDLAAGGRAAPRACVDPPALGELGSLLIAATSGPASAAEAVVVVENGHDQDVNRLDRVVTAQVSRKVGPLGDQCSRRA